MRFGHLIAGCFAGALLASAPAIAHPHVFVSVKTTVVATDDGLIREVRHVWTFDEPFSAYATLGLDTDKDGKLSRDELAPLAKVNVESLEEYGYFTFIRKDEVGQAKERAAFGAVKDFHLAHDGKALTLHFTLPLAETKHALANTRFEVYDPEFFVSFGYAEKDPVLVEGTKTPCTARLTPPKQSVFARLSQLGESFFQQQGGNTLNADWSTPVRFSCK